MPWSRARRGQFERREVLEGRQLMLSTSPFDRKLQLCGIILILGLLVESLCLLGHGPIAFIVFAGLGGVLFAVGILLYLFSLVGQGGTLQGIGGNLRSDECASMNNPTSEFAEYQIRESPRLRFRLRLNCKCGHRRLSH